MEVLLSKGPTSSSFSSMLSTMRTLNTFEGFIIPVLIQYLWPCKVVNLSGLIFCSLGVALAGVYLVYLANNGVYIFLKILNASLILLMLTVAGDFSVLAGQLDTSVAVLGTAVPGENNLLYCLYVL